MMRILKFRAALSRLVRAALLIMAAIALTSSSAGAQAPVKQLEDIVKELQQTKERGIACEGRVSSAGYSNFIDDDGIVVTVACADGSILMGEAPREREQAILSVALTALSTGKTVVFATTSEGGEIFILAIVRAGAEK